MDLFTIQDVLKGTQHPRTKGDTPRQMKSSTWIHLFWQDIDYFRLHYHNFRGQWNHDVRACTLSVWEQVVQSVKIVSVRVYIMFSVCIFSVRAIAIFSPWTASYIKLYTRIYPCRIHLHSHTQGLGGRLLGGHFSDSNLLKSDRHFGLLRPFPHICDRFRVGNRVVRQPSAQLACVLRRSSVKFGVC